MVPRKEYLERLSAWKDEQVIKVVTGVRRCGKSTLLEQYQKRLLDQGVQPEQIISINFEKMENEPLQEYHALYEHIKSKMTRETRYYIFLDEIQMVGHYERVVDSLYTQSNTDLYITGSNAYLLSSDLATLLTGRYVEISMLPLSFREYCELSGGEGETAFAEYLRYGGLPYVATMEQAEEKIDAYLEGIYNTVIVRDIEERQKRRERDTDRRKINDIALLKNIAQFLASSIGSQVSVKSVTSYLCSNGRPVSPNTVDDYIQALTESFIFYEVERMDISGKQLLKANKKYYMVDLGLRSHILPKRRYDLGRALENVVYFELCRRGYQVNVGKLGEEEVDFVARKGDALTYFQVTADMTAEETFQREMRPLRKIKDNYEKIILTLDKFTPGNYEGIKAVQALEWLRQA